MSKTTLSAVKSEIRKLEIEVSDVSSLMAEVDKQIKNAMDDIVGASAQESIKQIKAEFDYNFKKGICELSGAADRLSAGYNCIGAQADAANQFLKQADDIRGNLGKYE